MTLPAYDDKGKKIGGMTIEEACRNVGIHPSRWYAILDADSSFRKLYDDARAKRKEIMIDKAMSNVEAAIYGKEKLRPIDKVNVSMRFLEKTSNDFKDKVEIDLGNDVMSESLEDMMVKANEILKSLQNNKQDTNE